MDRTKTRKKAVAAGHICLDITPKFRERNSAGLEQLIRPGKLIQTGTADIHAGGAVANTGMAMQFFGIETTLMGKIGHDDLGEILLSKMGSRDNHAMKVSPDSSTSYSIVLAPPGSDRMFLHHPGANDTFTACDIDGEILKEAHLFHLGYPPLMRSLYENHGKELIEIFQNADSMGVITSLDMAAVDPESEAGQQDWSRILAGVLPYVDFFFPSLEELCYMIDRQEYQQITRRMEAGDMAGLSVSRDVEPLAQKAAELGARNIIIKCGAAGLYYRTGSYAALRKTGARLGQDMGDWENRSGFEKSYRPGAVVSGTGAGDTAIAAFLAALLNGYSLDLCLKLAAATGASCVEAYDALSGLLPLDEQLERIRHGLEKQNFIRE